MFPLFALWTPYGLAVDSKGNLYIADGKVGAIFVFNTETVWMSSMGTLIGSPAICASLAVVIVPSTSDTSVEVP